MSAPSTTEEGSSSFTPFTKEERIQQLNDIDRSITQLLQSAGLALKTLSYTNTQSTPNTVRLEAFQVASNSYLKTLQIVDVALKRQIIGLEEADIIPAEKATAKKKEEQNLAGLGKAAAATEQSIAEGGMGKLDIGWLNSQSGRVGRDMEAELWEKARNFLQKAENGVREGAENEHEEEDKDFRMGP